MPSEEELRALLASTAEAAELDFKSKFDVADAGDWLEIIKDIAAFANSGGGTILIVVNDRRYAIRRRCRRCARH